MKRKVKQRGFTLGEVMICVLIVFILAGTFYPTLSNELRLTHLSRAKSDVAGLAKAIARMRRDTGVLADACLTNLTNLTSSTLPTVCKNPNVTGMALCNASPQGKACWGGPYITSVANDPWDNNYQAFVDHTTWAVTVVSPGPNLTIDNGFDDISYVQ